MVDITKGKEIIAGLILLLSCNALAQNPQETDSGVRIMFYNVENLFHPSDDSLKNDDEFTPKGERFWSFKRYYDKINKVGKTAIAVGEWEPPAIIGLCEIEDIKCLSDLIYSSPLKRFGYEIVHHESGDRRGIDVAILYRPDAVQVIHHEPIILDFGGNSRPTRDILYVKGLANETDTLHLFVNHWPSRYGGQLITAPKRDFAAQILRSKYDSIMKFDPNAAIVAMGDFNDHPDDPSMLEHLRAERDTVDLKTDDLVNLIWQYEFKQGTHKYDHEWGILDQFIVTQAMLNGKATVSTSFDKAQIFDAQYLLEEEKDGIGQIPNRTYIGFKYHGGYSDHLPIYLDVLFR